ncbi:rhomboid family intramembrane serine protease [Streptomyces sp. NPDC005438]|uniref:rhomboid family intramembrane serine protease n=1 Tax=Streptomyces sp. NPDC005438 TaxID=3156880 RepID=UPI0033BD234C
MSTTPPTRHDPARSTPQPDTLHSPRGGRPTRARPLITRGLMAVCGLSFLLGPASGFFPAYGTGRDLWETQSAYFHRWGLVPHELWNGHQPETLLTPLSALFLHGNWIHLLGNLLFLSVFGGLVEQRLGRWRFLACYLTVGCCTMLSYAAVYPDSTQTLVGASGSISGVLGVFLWLFPRHRVTSVFPFLLFLPLRFPAWMVLVFWVVLQSLAVRADSQAPGVAYLTHVIGFALGLAYAVVFRRRHPEAPPEPGPGGR